MVPLFTYFSENENQTKQCENPYETVASDDRSTTPPGKERLGQKKGGGWMGGALERAEREG